MAPDARARPNSREQRPNWVADLNAYPFNCNNVIPAAFTLRMDSRSAPDWVKAMQGAMSGVVIFVKYQQSEKATRRVAEDIATSLRGRIVASHYFVDFDFAKVDGWNEAGLRRIARLRKSLRMGPPLLWGHWMDHVKFLWNRAEVVAGVCPAAAYFIDLGKKGVRILRPYLEKLDQDNRLVYASFCDCHNMVPQSMSR